MDQLTRLDANVTLPSPEVEAIVGNVLRVALETAVNKTMAATASMLPGIFIIILFINLMT